MTTPTPTTDVATLTNRANSGASWFYWIAGLSLVNTIAAFTGSDWRFIVGVGLTQVIDELVLQYFQNVGTAAKGLVLAFDLVVAGMIIALGVLAHKGHLWAFIVGMIGYSLDGLIFLLAGDWIGVGFHVFAVFCIFSGYRAARMLSRLPPPVPMPATAEPVSQTSG